MTRTYHDFFSLFQERSEKEDLWDLLKKDGRPIYIYGMGNGADRLADRLQTLGLSESGYFASDAFVRGQCFRGHRVQTFSSVLEKEKSFIALLAFGSRLPNVIEGFHSVSARVPFFIPDLPLVGNTYFDRSFLKEHVAELAEAAASLCDAASRDLFCDLILYKLRGELTVLMRAVNSNVPLFSLKEEETAVDLGAYTGDSIAQFRASYPGIKNYIAVEADAKNYRKLEEYASNSLADGISIRAIHGAAGEKEGSVSFFSSGNRNSSRANPSHVAKTVCIPSVTVDRLAADQNVGLIKFDVEGMEAEAILGCAETISRCRPVLKISVYHRSEDLHHLLLLCKSLYPHTQYYLRRNPCVPAWEADLYVIPEERSISNA